MGGWPSKIREAVSWAKTISDLLGWLGWLPAILGILAAIGGGIWAVIIGVPYPIAIMAGYCTLVGAVYLVMAPMAFRALINVPRATPLRRHGPNYRAWGHLEKLTLRQAAFLWSELDPNGDQASADVMVWLDVLFDAVRRGDLKLDETNKKMPLWRNFPINETFTTRLYLREFAKMRGENPKFLRAN